jgi:phage protein D
VGNEVEIQMGYVDNLQKLMVGEITGLEPEFSANEVPMLTVRGYDRRHRLLRGRKTRSFTQVKDSDIASQIAADAGLTAQVEGTAVTLDYVLQHNQSDLQFLRQRARRIGYEVVVEDKTLHFRPHQNAASEVLTLTWENDLIEFHPRLTTLEQVGQVAVRGWNPKDKEAVVAEAAAGSESSTMGGTTGGPSAADGAFGQSSYTSIDWPVFSQAEADKMAVGQFNNMALAYISGEGIVAGRTELRAGTVVKIEGLGDRFSGNYYVISATHMYTPRNGYRTAFSVRRNAS